MSALRKNKMILHQLDYYTIILSQITHLRSLVAQQMTRPANTQLLNILEIQDILEVLTKFRKRSINRSLLRILLKSEFSSTALLDMYILRYIHDLASR